MQFLSGNPASEGRYVVLVRCEGRQVGEWAEPVIATWHGEKWHLPNGRLVYGWCGPIPLVKCADLLDAPTTEYDL
jgi:hypothetical protein